VRLVPKLKYEHIHLNSFSKMRVDLAAQVSCCCVQFHYSLLYLHLKVFSETVSKVLTFSGDPEVTETAKFVLMFDRFFDCLNVTNFDHCKNERKVFQNPYRKPGDFRIKVGYPFALVYLNHISVAPRRIFTVFK